MDLVKKYMEKQKELQQKENDKLYDQELRYILEDINNQIKLLKQEKVDNENKKNSIIYSNVDTQNKNITPYIDYETQEKINDLTNLVKSLNNKINELGQQIKDDRKKINYSFSISKKVGKIRNEEYKEDEDYE